VTHEEFILAVRDVAVARIGDAAVRLRLTGTKVVYGQGKRGIRGVCRYSAWENGSLHDFIEVGAICEESRTQLAGTTLHELAHVLAGPGAGHGPAWKAAASTLGLVHADARDQDYRDTDFTEDIWRQIERLASLSDGRPALDPLPGRTPVGRPCPAGIGVRGGRSRGPGSGSRLRLWICRCPVKARVASDDFRARCLVCDSTFTRYEG
jgi:hypothetical protein